MQTTFSFPNKKPAFSWFVLLILPLLCAGTLPAAVIVNWNGVGNEDYTSGGYNGQVLETGTDFWHRYRTFSMSTALNPGAGNVQQSERFYGGIEQRMDGEINMGNLNSQIQNITGGTRSINRMQSNSTTDPALGHVRATFFWNSADFLNVGQPVELLAESTFTLNTTSFGNGWLRFAVQVDDEFYVTVGTFNNEGLRILTIDATTEWYEWDPTQNNMLFDPTGLEPLSLSLNNVQSVGFTYQANNINGQGGSASRQGLFFWNQFEVVAIPEPRAVFLVVAGLGALLLRKRRR